MVIRACRAILAAAVVVLVSSAGLRGAETVEHPFLGVTHIGAIVNVSSDNPAGRSVASNLAVFAALDTISPSTTALASPGANAQGWNNTDVTVTLNAADNHGGFVRDIYFALAGAQAGDPQVVPGQTTSSRITTEGTTLAYSATDYAGTVPLTGKKHR